MSMRVMIGSRVDVERHIDDIIGRLPGHEHLREQVVRAMADLLIDYVGEQIDSVFDCQMNWAKWIDECWPGEGDFWDDLDRVCLEVSDEQK